MMSSLFITGASGFIGRHLLAKLASQRHGRIFCLTRRGHAGRSGAAGKDVQWVNGSLFDSRLYGEPLSSSEVVVHLAATTGKAPRQDYFKINAAGTRYLLDQCKDRGVQKILYVSSIAVKYKNKANYHYARSKLEGEEAVRSSGIRYTIIRPTIVLGKEAPGWNALSSLAKMPWIPIVGSGSARIQPIAVDDLATALAYVIEENRFANETLEIGGPDVVSIEEFLIRLHRLFYGNDPRTVHLPYKPMAWLVTLAEKTLSPWTPCNAGQLSVFVEDGTVAPNDLYDRYRSRMKGLDSLLESLARDGHTNVGSECS